MLTVQDFNNKDKANFDNSLQKKGEREILSTRKSMPTCNIEFQEVNPYSLLNINFYGVRDSSPRINLEFRKTTRTFFISFSPL